jgi:Cof subfamily protein (haloacid dehalogenase superfamily)
MTRIYFFDIDNTLLDHRTNAIPRSALLAIAALQRAGHTVALATGRSYGHAKPYVDQIRPSYTITHNGARILKGDREVLSIALPAKPLNELFEWMHGQGHCFGINDVSTGYISAAVPWVLAILESVDVEVRTDALFYRGRAVNQGWLFFDASLDEQLYPQIARRYPEFDLVRWHAGAVDILPRAINKWTACQWVMAQAGFVPAQAIAFGDGLNDIEMLQGVGLGVAMENGHPALKAAANRVAPALHLDGIAIMLNELAMGGTTAPGPDRILVRNGARKPV